MAQRFMNAFTKEEYEDAAYALRELSNRRREQAIDWKHPELSVEADKLWELSARFIKASKEAP